MKILIFSFLIVLLSITTHAQGTAIATKNHTFDAVYTSLDTVKNKKGELLHEVVVTANQLKKPITALRSGLKPMDIPQSVQVIDNEIIQQQQSIRLSEVVKNLNGVYVSSARGGATESFWSRGYDMSANNMFKNGFRVNSGSIPEVSSLEKIEFLKGSAALLYGNVSPGGILNLVTKTPSFKSGGELSMQAGSNSFYKPSIDIYGPLNGAIAYRFVGTYENSESFRDFVKKERYYINPSFLFKVSDKTEITVQGDYLNDDWTPDFGTVVIEKEFTDISRNKFLGSTWSTGKTTQSTFSGLINHNFNSNWKLNFNTSFQNYDRTFKGTERIAIDTKIKNYVKGDWNRPLGQNHNVEQITAQQLSLQGNFSTGKVKHQVFTGTDFENSFAQAYTFAFLEKGLDGKLLYPGGIYDRINVFNYNYDQANMIVPSATNTRIVKTDTNRFGIYAQDLISFSDKFKVLAGLRWSWQEAAPETTDFTKNPIVITEAPKRKDQAFSPKAGLVYQPTKDLSLFTSYANSFTPNTGTTADGQAIKSSIIDQYEAGIKKDFWRGTLSTNVTVYQITNSNLAQTAEFKADGITSNTDTTVKVLSGSTKSKGIELDITARPLLGLNITAGYSYNDMRYTETSGLNGSFIQGDRIVRTPANTANLSFFYTLQSGMLKGLSLGSIANYIGNRVGGWNNQYDATKPNGIWDREIPIAGYTTLDISAGYTWKQFSILCKLSNSTNALNYTVHENYSVNPIAPRQVMSSLRYKF